LLSGLGIGTAASLLSLSLGWLNPAQAGNGAITLNGSPVQGALQASDGQLEDDNSHYDIYTFPGRAGQQVTITMTSREIDSYLWLLDPQGNSLIQDDDGAGGTDARIVYTLPVDGTYTIVANSYDGGVLGRYTLQASAGGGGPTAGTAGQNGGGSTASRPTPSGGRFFCDQTGTTPATIARSRTQGDVRLIEWTSDWAPPPYSPVVRCEQVSERMAALQQQYGTLRITVGYLSNQPVVCAARSSDEGRNGICASDGLIITLQNIDEAYAMGRNLRSSFASLVAGRPIGIVTASDDNSVPYIEIQEDF
jgi:hypothetical protein